MYVPAGAPLPQNSLDNMPAKEQAWMQNCIASWNLAAANAKRNAYIYPSPLSGLPSPNLVTDMAQGQQQATPAAYSILTNQPIPPTPGGNGSTPGSIPAPEVVPLNAAASAEYGCSWDGSVRPPAPQPAPRLFLQPAPNTPQVLPPSGGAPPFSTPSVQPSGATTTNPSSYNPCPPGMPFQGRYMMGGPVCGTIQYGKAAGGGGFARGYTNYGVAGLGDSPEWSDAFVSYRPGSQSIGGDIMSAFRDHPWIALLLAAGLGFGIAATSKRR